MQTQYTFTSNTTFSVPQNYYKIIVELWSAGGGGGAGDGVGGTGSQSNPSQIQSLSLIATSGFGGTNSLLNVAGNPGIATGGDINLNGNTGGYPVVGRSGAGANCPNGGLGGTGVLAVLINANTPGNPGNSPGGGGSGGNSKDGGSSIFPGDGGGSGAYLSKAYSFGTLSGNLTIEIASQALGGTSAFGAPGGNGAGGQAVITIVYPSYSVSII
jgi:hypothetical protein